MTSLRHKEICLFEATRLLAYKLERSRPLFITIEFIRSVHKEIYSYYRPAAGNFRTPVYRAVVTSKTFKPVEPNMIRIKLLNLAFFMNNPKVKAAVYRHFTRKISNYKNWNKKTKKFFYALFCASYIHHQITIIHPFTGGNGRLARLFMSMELANHGLYGPTFPPLLNTAIALHRDKYISALEAADARDMFKFILFLGDMLVYSIKNEPDLLNDIKRRLGNP